MKKQIIAGIGIIVCVALCVAVWPQSAEVGDLLAEPEKAAVSAKIEARAEEVPSTFISTDASSAEAEPAVENEPEMMAEKEREKAVPAQTTQSVKQSPTSSEPHNGDVRVEDGEKQIFLLGFGWIKDEGGGSVGTMVGNPGDQLTGHKVGIMGGATVGSDGDINKQVGIMGGDKSAPSSTSPPAYAKPEISGDIIYTELQPPVTKDSTPPAFKPNGEPYNP